MTTETKTLREQFDNMTEDEKWDRLKKKIDDLYARVKALEWEATK